MAIFEHARKFLQIFIDSKNFQHFKEKKFDGKRLYYLIYENFFVILAIAISDKKAQQATINSILIDLAEYQQYVYGLLSKK